MTRYFALLVTFIYFGGVAILLGSVWTILQVAWVVCLVSFLIVRACRWR